MVAVKEEEEEEADDEGGGGGFLSSSLFFKKKKKKKEKRKSLDSVYLRFLTPSSSRSVPAAGTNSHVLLSIRRRTRAGD